MRGFAGAIEVRVLLHRFVECREEAAAERLLERILNRCAAPVIQLTLARKSLSPAEAETVSLNVMERLVPVLYQARETRSPETIRHFQGYVTLLTNQAFGDFLDDRYVERRRLKQRIRYLLRHQPQMADWPSADGRTLCGLAEWRAEGRALKQSARWIRLRQNPRSVAEEALPQASASEALLPLLVSALLRWTGHPVELEELVSLVAEIQELREMPIHSAAAGDEEDAEQDPYARVADPRMDMEGTVQNQDYLRHLWAEIKRLSVKQRAALLLGMKDASGNPMLELFAAMRIARLTEIAEQLEMTWEQFAALWKELPLEDRRIAGLLGISPENVRFQRHAARTRLQERLTALA